MKQRYGENVQEFNGAYNTAFASWEELGRAANWRQRTDPTGNMQEERDNLAFLLRILERSWSCQVQAIRSVDSNHLIMGDTLNLNEPVPDEVIALYARHFPVITYQYYGATMADHMAVVERLHRIAPQSALFNADSSWSVPDPDIMPDTLGPQCVSHGIRAERMRETFRAAFSHPAFVGWGWCGWMDNWESAEPHMQHAGLQTAFGKWHQPAARTYREFAGQMYQIAQSAGRQRTSERLPRAVAR
jgi:hypothetical protein